VPSARHQYETEIRGWLKHKDELPRFERLTAGCKTQKEAILKLMEIAEQAKKTDKDAAIEKLLEDAKNQISPEEAKTLRDKIETLELNEKKLKRALEDERRKNEKLQKQPQSKVEYKEVIKEVPRPIGIEKERLQKTIGSLENILKTLPKVVWELKETILYFQVTQQARAERQAKAEIQPSTNKQGDSPPQPPVMERTTKRTTTEEINEKIPMQETEDQKIICPSGKGIVSVKKECMHECQDFAQCPTYIALLKNYTRNP
jgi:hypothetical protein